MGNAANSLEYSAGSVGNEDDNVQIGVAVSAGASWALYSDADCRNPLAGNVMPLEVGENTAYLRVIAEDTTTSKVYTVTITRAPEQGDDNGPGNDENNGGNQDDNNNLDNDENNNENKPIDKFGQSTSAPYILAVLGALVAGAVVTLSIFKKKEA